MFSSELNDFIKMPYLFCRGCNTTIIEYDQDFSKEDNEIREKYQKEQKYMSNIKIKKNMCNCELNSRRNSI